MEEKFGVTAAAALLLLHPRLLAVTLAVLAEEQTEFDVSSDRRWREESKRHQGCSCSNRPGLERSQGSG